MSKYRLPNGLVVNLDDTTGETTVVGGGGRTIAPGARLAPSGDLLGASGAPQPTQRPSELAPPAARGNAGEVDPDENVSPQVPQGRTAPSFSGGSQPLADLRPPTDGLVKEDPIGTVIAGAGAAKAGAAAARGIGGLVGTAVEGATLAGVPELEESGSPRAAARAALAGAAVGPAVELARSLPGAVGDAAKAANAARLPTAVTGGARGKAAAAVTGARHILQETAEAHPDLQRTLLTGGDDEKLSAIGSKLDQLTSAQDADIEHIAQHHPQATGGRVPTAVPLARLGQLANEAHKAGDARLKKAAQDTIDAIREFDEGGTISPAQLRGVRNDIATTIGGNEAPGTPAAAKARANKIAVKSSLNGALETLADETPGIDVAAHKVRNRQIASLLPAQDFLEHKAEAEAGKPQRGLAGKAVEAIGNIDIAHPLRNVTKPAMAIADQVLPRLDLQLAKLAGSSGPAGVQALKAVIAKPTKETLAEAVRVGVAPRVALQVARMGNQQAVAQ